MNIGTCFWLAMAWAFAADFVTVGVKLQSKAFLDICKNNACSYFGDETLHCQYDDVRCKCVCPTVALANGTTSRTVFIKSFNEPSKCKCENVVDKEVQESEYHFCEHCDCQWQRRNTTTIMVVVMFAICILAVLFLYMFFLQCIDPLLSRGPVPYSEQSKDKSEDQEKAENNEADKEKASSSDVFRIVPNMLCRIRNKMHFVKGEQQKWKGQVQEQREHIYDKRTILN